MSATDIGPVTAAVTRSRVADPKPLKVASVDLRGTVVPLDSDIGREFISDCCRYNEGLMSDGELKQKWEISEQAWEELAGNKPLLAAVQAERIRRIHNGQAAREGARWHVAKAPGVLGGILMDKLISPRHRVEAARELRQAAESGPDTSAPTEKFVISINLGGDQGFYREFDIPQQEQGASDAGEAQ